MDIQIISASAGSGKTYRLALLLEEELLKQESGTYKVRPDAILATTFTKKAAAELQERVRSRLLAAGLKTEAQQLSASRIGTVNSVCGGLLTDFAFDLGISPGQKVIDEGAVSGVISRAMARVIDKGTSKELWQLERNFPGTELRKVIEALIAKARANGLDSDDLLQSGAKSVAGFLELFGEEAKDQGRLDQDLHAGINAFLQGVDTNVDSTKITKDAIALVRRSKSRLHDQKKLPWAEWLRLAKLKTAVKSKHAAEPLRLAAACHDSHPGLRQDADRLITLTFELAAKTLDAYQEYKREWGVVDFTDQEVLTLELLNMEQPARILREQLDLVLVDEFQDTSPIQLAIFLKLAGLAKKSVWVGDQKQAIYGFRDADPSLMDAAITGILGGAEPETLQNSWRSHPDLVRSTSDIFVEAFATQGFPEQRVRLEPAEKIEKAMPQGLSPVYECWHLESKNKNNDALALASLVRDFLADPENTIRDPKNGQKRLVRGGDVAVLCRENDVCLTVAAALEQQGVEAALPRPGLLSCPEIILTLAAVRLLIDSRDSLARAEIARLLDDPADHNGFLQKALAGPYAGEFKLDVYTRLEQAREALNMAGPLQVLDRALEAMDIRQLCLAWGNSEARLANLDSLRALCVNYLEECRSSGSGASPAGMLAHLDSLKNDTRAVVQNEDTVQVLTWHKSKGLEWPVTVLFQLEKVFPALPLGVNVVSDAPFRLDAPLANRWLRYWPNPYGNFKTGAPFFDRLVENPATVIHADKEKRQELRLLYVGWTRARDRVVLAGRAGFLQKGILRLLVNNDGNHLLTIPAGQTAVWAGRKIEITSRTGNPAESVSKSIQPGTGYKPGELKEYPPAFQSVSSIEKQGLISAMEKIGDRLPITANPDMQALGEAIHTFLGADDHKKEQNKRLISAEDILERWQVTANLKPEHMLSAGDHLHTWVTGKWPTATWRREYPVAMQKDNGTVVSGFIDLLLEVPEGFVIIDHKSFPGGLEEARKKAVFFAGQLAGYAEAVEAATDKDVIGCFIHLPVSGLMAEL